MNKSDFSRAIHIDFHTMPGIYDINDFDAEKFADYIEKAHVTYVNIFAQCNIGFCYYPTKIGIMYPGLKRDMFGELLTALKKRGIGVTAYINSGINHANLRKHPEWRLTDINGVNENPPVFPNGKDNYRVLDGCFNTSYGDFVKSIIKEIVDNYDVDGVFLDCVPMHKCYCEKCRSDMQAQGIDINDEQSTYNFSESVRIKLAEDVKKIVGDKHSFFNSWYTWTPDFQDHIEIECLPNTWSYEFFAPHVAYARSLNKDVLYMTGRFQNDWGDFGGICSKASIEHDMFDAIMNDVGFSIGDHAHPSKFLIPKLYGMIKDIYADLKQYQIYTEGTKYNAEIAIYSGKAIREYDMWKHKGICHMLSELKHTYNIVRNLENVNEYNLVILPNETQLDEQEVQVLEQYIKQGGKVLSCAQGGFKDDKSGFALKELIDATDYCGVDTRTNTYFEFNESVQTEMSDITWATYMPSVLMKAKDCQVVADDVKSYFDKHFDGTFNFLYIPPEKKTEYASAILTKNVAHVSFNVFDSYRKYFLQAHKELVRMLIEKLMPNSLIKTQDLPVSSRATLLENEDRAVLCVKTTFAEIKAEFVDSPKGIINDHITVTAGKKVLVKGKYKNAIDALSGKEITIKEIGGYTEVVLPEINGFIMVVMSK